MIKSPYNFVPLNDKVFFPYWSKYVSQDVPFKEGKSGKIKLKIKAETPIFIRGEERTNTLDDRYKEYHFSKLNGKYCIPGTSIKGELESVMENLSFSKLKLYNKDKYSIRDWNNAGLYHKSLFANCYGGWLYVDENNEYKIKYNLKKPGRIDHAEIDSAFNTNFVSTFGAGFRPNDDKYKAAKKKYDLINGSPLDGKQFIEDYTSKGRVVYKISAGGERGTIVFTGQASARKKEINRETHQVKLNADGSPKWVGKHLEFIFWEPIENPLPVNKQTVKDFFFAYFDDDVKKQSIDWKYWKPKLNDGAEIPVFFQLDDDGKVEHLGLSMLYKLPYNYGVKDLVQNHPNHIDERLDLIETIFGYVTRDGHETEASKGRVSIEPALNTNDSVERSMKILNLGSPKASFYPFYIWQNPGENDIVDNYFTFNDTDAVIAGRKRFPVQNSVWGENLITAPSKTTTSFYPLPAGAEFDTVLHYHNLRPVELGAVLSALTFHGNSDKCRHSLGMAKPHGFGKVCITVEYENSDISESDAENYMSIFQNVMTNFKRDWMNSEQLNELFSIATPVDPCEKLTYPILDPQRNMNEFSGRNSIKESKEALPRYSAFMNIDYTGYKGKIPFSNFNVEDDKQRFVIKTSVIKNELNKYLSEKQNQIKQDIQEELTKIEKLITEELMKKEIALQAEKKETNRREADLYQREKGISLLLEQTKIDDLISKTNTWVGKYYSKEEQKKNMESGVPKIPEEHQHQFLKHVTSIYLAKPNDRNWKSKIGVEGCDGYKYLIKCVGTEKAKEWLKNKILN